MEANKTDCEKCIRIAQEALASGNYEKAAKFCEKSNRLYPNETAKKLLEKINELKSQTSSEKSNETNSESKEQAQNDASTTHRRRKTTENESTSKPAGSKDYSTDQVDAVKKIKGCSDFYEILGVPKEASEMDLKKAYKKLALQFHPDKNKAPGATDAFKKIGKAFAILSDNQKRKQYDHLGPGSFESEVSSSNGNRYHRSSHYYGNSSSQYTNYWNDDEFSADELFNLFFGGNYAHAASATHRRRHNMHANGQQGNYVFTNTTSNNYAVLFQLMPIILIVLLSLLSNLMIGEPAYSLQKTGKYNHKRITNDHHVPYYVKSDFRVESTHELNKVEKQVEEDLLIELRQSCFREKNYKETAIWRARHYGDERLLKKALDIETPSCDKINHIFGGG